MSIKDSFCVTGKTALVTGSSQGIGRAIALALAEHGANVVVNCRSNLNLAKQTIDDVRKMGVKAWLWEYDLSSETITRDFNEFIQKK